MGACDFSVFKKGADASKAFRSAVDDARYEDGHGGYSGTIAEKSSFQIIQHAPVTMEEARKIVDAKICDNDKWGPAFALPVKKKEGSEIEGWVFFGFASS